MKIQVHNLAQIENVKNNCINRFRVDNDLKFMILRLESFFEAQLSLIRLDTFEKVTIDFFDYDLLQTATLMYDTKGFMCQTDDPALCQGLPPYAFVQVMILSLDIDPTNGSAAMEGEIKYSLEGSYQSVTCGKCKCLFWSAVNAYQILKFVFITFVSLLLSIFANVCPSNFCLHELKQ